MTTTTTTTATTPEYVNHVTANGLKYIKELENLGDVSFDPQGLPYIQVYQCGYGMIRVVPDVVTPSMIAKGWPAPAPASCDYCDDKGSKATPCDACGEGRY